jgi:hypothetical protein
MQHFSYGLVARVPGAARERCGSGLRASRVAPPGWCGRWLGGMVSSSPTTIAYILSNDVVHRGNLSPDMVTLVASESLVATVDVLTAKSRRTVLHLSLQDLKDTVKISHLFEYRDKTLQCSFVTVAADEFFHVPGSVVILFLNFVLEVGFSAVEIAVEFFFRFESLSELGSNFKEI